MWDNRWTRASTPSHALSLYYFRAHGPDLAQPAPHLLARRHFTSQGNLEGLVLQGIPDSPPGIEVQLQQGSLA